MDGPNTNWAVLNKVTDHRNKNELPQIMDVGSCGLHVVHRAFKTGAKTTGYQLENILKSMQKLFNYSPSRRDLYIKLNQTDEFPLMFCMTRWVEDALVASHAMAVWKNVVKVVQHYQSQSKLNQPNDNILYNHLVKYRADLLIPVKFQFFKDVADMLSPYLQQFQTDAPMMPFVCGALEEIIRCLMRMILRSTIVAKASTAYELVRINLNNKENQLPHELIKFPMATKSLLSSAVASDTK